MFFLHYSLKFLIRLHNTYGDLYLIFTDCFIKLSVQTFHQLIVIYRILCIIIRAGYTSIFGCRLLILNEYLMNSYVLALSTPSNKEPQC